MNKLLRLFYKKSIEKALMTYGNDKNSFDYFYKDSNDNIDGETKKQNFTPSTINDKQEGFTRKRKKSN